MKITYLAHSCFLLRTKDDVSIVIDPYQPGAFGDAVKYKPIQVWADIVLVTHEHRDHNAVEQVDGKPEVIRKPGEWIVRGIPILGVKTFHDSSRGKERGSNTIFVVEADGIRLVHLGDLGHGVGDEEKGSLGKVDVLLVPVGGFYTIGPEEAWSVVQALDPRIVIPMHYKTPRIEFPIAPVDEFLAGKSGVKRIGASEVEIILPKEREIWVLQRSC